MNKVKSQRFVLCAIMLCFSIALSFVCVKSKKEYVYATNTIEYNSAELSYTVNGTNATIVGYTGTIFEVPTIINDGANTYTVTAIGDEVVYDAETMPFKNVTSVTIPGTVELKQRVFRYATNLKTVTLQEGITTIPFNCFYECTALETVNLPNSFTTFGKNSNNNGQNFCGCSSLKSITIPYGVTDISSYCFSRCSSLETVVLPSTCIIFSENSSGRGCQFYSCSSLKSINLQEGMTEIPYCCFDSCASLTSINFPSTLTYIDSCAFYGTGLTGEITIPKNCWLYTGTNNPFLHCQKITGFKIEAGGTTPYYVRDGAIYSTTDGIEYLHVYPDGRTADTLVLGEYTVIERYVVSNTNNLKYLDATNSKIYKNDRKLTGDVAKAFLYSTDYKHLLQIASGIKLNSYIVDAECITIDNLSNVTVNVDGTNKTISTLSCSASGQIDYIYLPESITAIMNNTFMSAKGITTLGKTMKDGTTDLSSTHITSCGVKPLTDPYIKTIKLPSTLNSITQSFLYQATNVETLVLNCPTVMTITEGTNYDSTLFASATKLKTIYVPDDLVDDYATARLDAGNHWSELASTVEIKGLSTLVESTVMKFTITFCYDDNTLYQVKEVAYGEIPTITNPTKASTAQYTYAFSGWDTPLTAVTGDATYTAQFTSTLNKYLVTFKNYDGTVLETKQVEYGATPTYTKTAPTRLADEQYTYTFSGWNSALTAVTGPATYTAQFTAVAKAVEQKDTSWFKNINFAENKTVIIASASVLIVLIIAIIVIVKKKKSKKAKMAYANVQNTVVNNPQTYVNNSQNVEYNQTKNSVPTVQQRGYTTNNNATPQTRTIVRRSTQLPTRYATNNNSQLPNKTYQNTATSNVNRSSSIGQLNMVNRVQQKYQNSSYNKYSTPSQNGVGNSQNNNATSSNKYGAVDWRNKK